MAPKHGKFLKYYMSIVGVLSQSAAFIQAYKIFTSRSAHDLSFIAVIIGMIAGISWLIYGTIMKDYPLMLTNLIGCIGCMLIIVGLILYG